MLDDDIVGALASHPAFGERVNRAKQAGIASRDIVEAMASGGPQQQPPSPLPPAVSVPMRNADGPIVPKDVPLSTGEKVATAPLKFLSGSAEQLGHGMTQVAHPESADDFAGGISNIARGAGGLALPAALPAMAAAPVAAATGLVAGTAVGLGTEYGAKALGVPPGTSEMLGTVAGGAAGGWAGNKASAFEHPTAVDPHVAALRAWGMNKDPHTLDAISNGTIKLSSGLSDLKPALADVGGVQEGYANESVLRAIPAAKTANRDAWSTWMNRAAGQNRSGEPIIRATIDSLKQTISDPRAQLLVNDAASKYGRPLNPQEMESLLAEKNAELKSFYSQSKEVQGAAERAGADTLKSKALLEAQARALRELLYHTLDPERAGAGPREIQQRYGALKAIEEAAHGRRTDIIGEHPVNPLERVANIHLDPRAAIKARQGSSEWLIENAIKHSPEPGELPRATGLYPMGGQRRISAGDIRLGGAPDGSYVRSAPGMSAGPNPMRALPAPAGPPIITPPPADTSYVAGRPGMAQPPNPARALPPATTRFAPMPGSTEIHPTTSSSPLVSGRGPTITPDSPQPSGDTLAVKLGRAILRALDTPGVK
jgi:hypothetical protein